MKKIIATKNIYDEQGLVLLTKGTEILLTYEKTRQLHRMGVLSEVLNQFESDNSAEAFEEVISELTQACAIKNLSELENTFPGVDSEALKKVTNIVSALVNVDQDFAWYRHIKVLFSYVEWLYGHSVNTSVLSGLIAYTLGYSEKQIMEVCLGALFHDIGLTLLPKETLEKKEKLTDAETAMLQGHCEMGYSMIKDLAIPETSKLIVLQHHEKPNGTGYPQKLHGREIREASVITMIAEFLDTATTERPYKAPKPVTDVLKEMREDKFMFPTYIVDALEKGLLN